MFETQFHKIIRPEFANKTLNWVTADNEENYYNIYKTLNLPYGPNDIEYKFNNYGFRCDNFEDYQLHPHRILFAGCSMTEGVGLPLDHIWPKILHKMICDQYEIEMPYWTIAAGGTGIDQMIRYIYNLKDLLKPQIIICYLPNMFRRELAFEVPWGYWSLDTPEGKDTKVFLEERLAVYFTEKNILLLELLLEKMNCTFLFSSSMEGFDITNFSKSPLFIQRPHVPEQYDIARDGIHAGPKTNKIMAERVFKYFENTITNKLGLTNPK